MERSRVATWRRWALAITVLGVGAAIAVVGFGSSRHTQTRVVVAASIADEATSTTAWHDPCEVTVPQELQGDARAVAEAAAQEKSFRADLGEICLPPDVREKLGERQARDEAARRTDPNYHSGPLDLPLGPDIPDAGLIDGTQWYPSNVFIPTNEWVEPSDSRVLHITAGREPGGESPDYSVPVDTGAVAVVLTAPPGKELSTEDSKSAHQLFRAPDGIGPLTITKVAGTTVSLSASDGKTVTFDIKDHTFTVG